MNIDLYQPDGGANVPAVVKGKEVPSVRFTDVELHEEVADFTPHQLRTLANVYEAWAKQCRFKADLMEGRILEDVKWIGN